MGAGAMDVRIGTEPGRHLAVTRFEVDLETLPQQMGEAFGAVARHLARIGAGPSGAAVAAYEIRPDGMTAAVGFAVPDPIEGDGTVVAWRLPECEVVTAEHVGPYEELPTTYAALREAATAQGRVLDETRMWEEYLTGPETPPAETRTIVSWPLCRPNEPGGADADGQGEGVAT